MTIETSRIISEEISNQMSWTLNEIKSSLKSQIQDVITTAIDEKVLPSIQNTLDTQARSNFTMADRSSSGLQRNLEVESRPETCFTQEKCRQMSKEKSVDSYWGKPNRDIVTEANPTPNMVPEFLTGRPMQSREPLQRQNNYHFRSQ